jgi:hypothetical protein
MYTLELPESISPMANNPATTRRPTDNLADGVALIAHPVVLGTLGLLTIVLNTIMTPTERVFYLILLMLLTFAPAALYLFVHFKGNIVQMLELIDREARLIPYILMIVGAVIAVATLITIEAPRALFIMTLVLLANEIVLGTINFWTKVSIHTATPTFTALTLGYLMNPNWYWLLLIVPLVGWARVYRKRHTLPQAISGAVFAGTISGLVLAVSHYTL